MKTIASNVELQRAREEGAVLTSSWLWMKWLTRVRGYRLLHASHAPKGVFFGRVVCDSTWWLRRI